MIITSNDVIGLELDKRRREQQSKLEEYNQCPSFVSSKYVWDLLQPSTLVWYPMQSFVDSALLTKLMY